MYINKKKTSGRTNVSKKQSGLNNIKPGEASEKTLKKNAADFYFEQDKPVIHTNISRDDIIVTSFDGEKLAITGDKLIEISETMKRNRAKYIDISSLKDYDEIREAVFRQQLIKMILNFYKDLLNYKSKIDLVLEFLEIKVITDGIRKEVKNSAVNKESTE